MRVFSNILRTFKVSRKESSKILCRHRLHSSQVYPRICVRSLSTRGSGSNGTTEGSKGNAPAPIIPVAFLKADGSDPLKILLIPINSFSGDDDAVKKTISTTMSALRDNVEQIEAFAENITPVSDSKTQPLSAQNSLWEDMGEANRDNSNSCNLVDDGILESNDTLGWVQNERQVLSDVPEGLKKGLGEAGITSMNLAFEMDMTNLKDAMNDPSQLSVYDEKDFPIENDLTHKTIPLNFNALIHGTVNIDSSQITPEKLDRIEIPRFNEYVTAIAANICSTALQKGFPSDISRMYSTKTSGPSTDKPRSPHVVCVREGGKGCVSPGNSSLDPYEPKGQGASKENSPALNKDGEKKCESAEADQPTLLTSTIIGDLGARGLMCCQAYARAVVAASKLREAKQAKEKKSTKCEVIKEKCNPETPCGPPKQESICKDKEIKEPAKRPPPDDPCRPHDSPCGTRVDGVTSVPKGDKPAAAVNQIIAAPDSEPPCKKLPFQCPPKKKIDHAEQKKIDMDPCRPMYPDKCPPSTGRGACKLPIVDPCKEQNKCEKKPPPPPPTRDDCKKDPCKKESDPCPPKKPPCKKASSATDGAKEIKEPVKCSTEPKMTAPKAEPAKCGAEKKAEPAKCEAKKPEPAKCEAKKPEPAKCEAKKPEPAKCEAKKPEPAKCEAKKPEPAKCEAKKPEPAKCEAKKPEPAKCEAKKPEPAKCEAKKPEPAKCEAKKPEPAKCEAKKPEPAKCEAKKPEPAKCEAKKKTEPKCGAEKKPAPAKCVSEKKTEPSCGAEKKAEPPKCGAEKKAEPPKCGAEKKAEPPKCGAEKKAEPPKCGAEKKAEPPKCGAEKKAEPPKCGSEKKAEPPKCGSEKKAEPPKCGSEKKAEPPKCGSEKKAEPPKCGSEKKAEPPKCGSEKKTEPSKCAEKKAEPPKCGAEKKAEPPKCGAEKKTEPSKCAEKKAGPSKCVAEKKTEPSCGAEKADAKSKTDGKSELIKCGTKTQPETKKMSSDASKRSTAKLTSPKCTDGNTKSFASDAKNSETNCGTSSGLPKDFSNFPLVPVRNTKPNCPNQFPPRFFSTYNFRFLSDLPDVSMKMGFESLFKNNGYLFASKDDDDDKQSTCPTFPPRPSKRQNVVREDFRDCFHDDRLDNPCHKPPPIDPKKTSCTKKPPKKHCWDDDGKENKSLQKQLALLPIRGKNNIFNFIQRNYSQSCVKSCEKDKGTVETLEEEITNEIVQIGDAGQVIKVQQKINQPSDFDVLVRVAAIALSGSDIHCYESGSKNCPGLTIGHDATGVVEKVGKCVDHLKRGDYVVMESGLSCGICDICKHGDYNVCPQLFHNGFLSTFQNHPSDLCYKLPKNLTLEDATLTPTVALACQACLKAHISPATSVLILGICPTACAAALCARALGAKSVAILTSNGEALESTQRLFNIDLISYEESETGSPQKIAERIRTVLKDRPNVIINYSISENTMNLSINLLKSNGICVLAECDQEHSHFNTMDVIMKNITLVPSFRSAGMYPIAMQLMKTGKVPIGELISRMYSWDQIRWAFHWAQYESNIGNRKVVVQCPGINTNYACPGF